MTATIIATTPAAALIARYVAAIDQADGRIAEQAAEIERLKQQLLNVGGIVGGMAPELVNWRDAARFAGERLETAELRAKTYEQKFNDQCEKTDQAIHERMAAELALAQIKEAKPGDWPSNELVDNASRVFRASDEQNLEGKLTETLASCWYEIHASAAPQPPAGKSEPMPGEQRPVEYVGLCDCGKQVRLKAPAQLWSGYIPREIHDRLLRDAKAQALREAAAACVSVHDERKKRSGTDFGFNAIMECQEAIERLASEHGRGGK